MKKTMSVISVILSLAMLLALLPVMGLTASADATDLLGGAGSFDTDISMFTLSETSYCEDYYRGEGQACVNGHDTTQAHSAVADTEVFTWAETAGVNGSGALLITPTAQGGNTPSSVTISGMDTTKIYTVSAKVKWNNAYLLWNYYAPEQTGYTGRWSNAYVIDKTGAARANVTTGPDADGWYTYSFSFKAGSNYAEWASMTMVPSVYAINAEAGSAVATGSGVDAENHYILLDDLTVTEHVCADEDGDGVCGLQYHDYATAKSGATGASANEPEANGVIKKACGTSFEIEGVDPDDLFEGAYVGDYEMDLTSAGNGYTGWADIEAGKNYEMHYWYKPTGTNTSSRVNIEFATDNSANALRLNNYGNTAALETDANGYNHHVIYFSTKKEVHNSVRFQIWNTSSSAAGSGIVKKITLVEHTEHHAADLTGACVQTVYYLPAEAEAGQAYNTNSQACGATDWTDDVLCGLGSFDNATASKAYVWADKTPVEVDGNYCIDISAYSTSRGFPITPGTQYDFSFKLKLDTTAGTPTNGSFVTDIRTPTGSSTSAPRLSNITIYTTANGLYGGNVFTVTELEDGWYLYEVGIKYEAATSFGISFGSASPAVRYIDDIKLTPHTEHTYGEEGNCTKSYLNIGTTGANGNSNIAALLTDCPAVKPLPENGDLMYGCGSFNGSLNGTGALVSSSKITYDAAVDAGNDPNSGSAKLDCTTAGWNGRLTRIVHPVAGQAYELVFKYRISDAEGNTYSPAEAGLGTTFHTNGTSGTARWVNWYINAVTDIGNGWYQFRRVFRHDDASMDFYIHLMASTWTGYYLHIDDLAVINHVHALDDNGACTDTIYTRVSGTNGTAACDHVEDIAKFTGATATLSDVIKLNLHLKTNMDAANLTVKLDETQYANNKSQAAVGYELPLTATATDGVYTAEVLFPAKNMADVITAKIMNGETEMDTISYSIKEYAMAVVNGEYTDAEKATAKAMLNYGASAQTYFNYKTSTLANADLDAADQVIDVENIAGVAGEEEVAVPDVMPLTSVGSYGAHNDSDFTISDEYPFGRGYKISPIADRSSAFSYAHFGIEDDDDMVAGTTYTLKLWYKIVDDTVNNTLTPSTNLYLWTTTWASQGVTLSNADGNWHYIEKVITYVGPTGRDYRGIQFQSTVGVGDSIEFAGITVQEAYEDNSGEMLANSTLANLDKASNYGTSYGWQKYGNTFIAAYNEEIGANAISSTGDGQWLRIYLNDVTEVGKTYTFSFKAKATDATTGDIKDLTISGMRMYDGQTYDYTTADTPNVFKLTAGDADANGWKTYTYTYKPTVAYASGEHMMLALAAGQVWSIAEPSFTEVVPEVTPVDTYKAGVTVTDDAMKSVFLGYSLILRDQTTVRLYFTEDITACSNGEAVINNDGTNKYVELPAVKATGLDTVGELTVTTASGTVTLTNFSTLAPAALAATKDNALAKVCTALILYAEAVNALV
ncbi:MAG: hypothetical protein IJC17_06295 [Clostridia bacterium]|nr:hypothetical protein [Clostridia bacterium]